MQQKQKFVSSKAARKNQLAKFWLPPQFYCPAGVGEKATPWCCCENWQLVLDGKMKKTKMFNFNQALNPARMSQI